MTPYKEHDYAATRLMDSVVRLKGEPVLVGPFLGKNVQVTNLTTLRTEMCELKDLDINPVPLGYLNRGGLAVYITRTPMRQDWRQGLRPISMRSSKLNKAMEYNWPELALTIKGKYPTLVECFDTVGLFATSMAFSREFAIRERGALEYKGNWMVGSINKRGKYDLDPKFEWVRESLEEVLH